MSSANILICGAGIAGIAAAHQLTVKQGIKDVVLVDERPPLTLTSDKSSESYRNWWPGPDAAMVQFMNRSLDLLDELAEESGNYFQMNRRGYVYLTANPNTARQMEKTAVSISQLGAGALRLDDPDYAFSPPHEWRNQPTGADLLRDPRQIRAALPFIADDVVAMLHTRRCGWLSAQQLGMYLLDEAKKQGARVVEGRVTAVHAPNNQIQSVEVAENGRQTIIQTRHFVNAAGPHLHSVGKLLGVEIPVFNELHAKVAFNDPLGLIPRHIPLIIWNDPIRLTWSDEERAELAEIEALRWLLDEFPAGLHFRPEGADDAQTALAIWTYHVKVEDPVAAPQFDHEFYPDVVLRGLTRLVPALSTYLERMSKPYIDGGYYCKTEENRPLISPLPIKGAYVLGALSGYGIMGAMAAGELLALRVCGGDLPPYATAFHLNRYQNPDYLAQMPAIKAAGGQL